MAETTPNTEMIMFSDMDLDKLKLVRNEGSVTNLWTVESIYIK